VRRGAMRATPNRRNVPSRPEGPPSDSELAPQLGELIRRIGRRLRRNSAGRLKSFGLTDGQARVLALVGRSPSPLRMSDIARHLDVVPRSATTVVASLELNSLVTREIDREDRRSIVVALTDAGRNLFDELGRERDEVAIELFGRLDPKDRRELLRLLMILGAEDSRREHLR
jgi:DNA-binding MarR family transcriptional regulator